MKSKKATTRNKKSKVKVEDLTPQQDPKGGAFDMFMKSPINSAVKLDTGLKIQESALNFTVKL